MKMKIKKKIWTSVFLVIWSIGIPLFMWWTYYQSQVAFQKCEARRASSACEHAFCDCLYHLAYLDIQWYILCVFVISFFLFLLFKKTRFISVWLLIFLTFSVLVAFGLTVIGNAAYVLYLLPIIGVVVSYYTKRISEQNFKNRLIVYGMILYPWVCFWVLRAFELK